MHQKPIEEEEEEEGNKCLNLLKEDWQNIVFRVLFVIFNFLLIAAGYYMLMAFFGLLEDEMLNVDTELYKEEKWKAWLTMIILTGVVGSMVVMGLLLMLVEYCKCRPYKGLTAFYGVCMFGFGFLGFSSVGYSLLS